MHFKGHKPLILCNLILHVVLTRQLTNSQIYFCFLMSSILDMGAIEGEAFQVSKTHAVPVRKLGLRQTLPLSPLLRSLLAQAVCCQEPPALTLTVNYKTPNYCTTFLQPKVILVPANSQHQGFEGKEEPTKQPMHF